MKLLFDLRATQTALSGTEGGGAYSRAVFKRLVACDTAGMVVGCAHPDFALDDEVGKLVADHKIAIEPVRNQDDLQALLSTERFGRYFSGVAYNSYGLDFGTMETFLVVHGLRPLEQRLPWHSWRYYRGLAGFGKWLTKYVLELVRPGWRNGQFQGLLDVNCGRLHVIVPSMHTQYSMRDHLHVGEHVRIHRFYCPETAVGQTKTPDSNILQHLGVEPGRYLLMVSGDRWIKNTWSGLCALFQAQQNVPVDRRLKVVVTGGLPHSLPRKWRSRIVSPGYLSIDELAGLYQGARVLFYPSLNEGFGYPPLEAMAWGTPVTCSAVCSLPEIVGEAGIFFNPTNEAEMRSRLLLVLQDDDLLAEYSRRAVLRIAEVRKRQAEDLEKLCELLLGSGQDHQGRA